MIDSVVGTFGGVVTVGVLGVTILTVGTKVLTRLMECVLPVTVHPPEYLYRDEELV